MRLRHCFYLFVILILGFLFFCPSVCESKTVRGIDTDWTNSVTFKLIKDSYGEKIPFNDGVFDCEDFVAAFFLYKDPAFPVFVGILFDESSNHVMAGMIGPTGQGVALVETQNGRYVVAKTFVEAAKQFYPNEKFTVLLIPYDVLMDYVWRPVK